MFEFALGVVVGLWIGTKYDFGPIATKIENYVKQRFADET